VTEACCVIDTGLYGALANAAAITTALQSIVAFLALQRGMDVSKTVDDSTKGTSAYNTAKDSAQPNLWGHGLLNTLALLVDAAVLAAWWKVGVFAPTFGQWEYWLPWCAVILASLVLTGAAVVGLWKLYTVARLP
jgi:hypothetical protein